VEPVEVIDREGSKTDVKVHQLVKTLSGDVLSDTDVWHVYTIANGLIERMDLKKLIRARTKLHPPRFPSSRGHLFGLEFQRPARSRSLESP
jgi:hypothetical protein